jgi:hypothetical protein
MVGLITVFPLEENPQTNYQVLTATNQTNQTQKKCLKNLGNPDPLPDPPQIKISMQIRNRICIKVISWILNRIRIRINLQMTSKNVGK